MSYLPNLLSCLRFPLAILFWQGDDQMRLTALFLAMVTDSLDGYLARRYSCESRIGTLLDPLADKFFMAVALIVLLHEGKINVEAALAMLSREGALLLFGGYLLLRRTFTHYRVRAIWCGKITTALQLAVLMVLVLGYAIPAAFYLNFVGLGVLAFVELLRGDAFFSKKSEERR